MRSLCGSSNGYGDFGGDGLRPPLWRRNLYAKRGLVAHDAGRRCALLFMPKGANSPNRRGSG